MYYFTFFLWILVQWTSEMHLFHISKIFWGKIDTLYIKVPCSWTLQGACQKTNNNPPPPPRKKKRRKKHFALSFVPMLILVQHSDIIMLKYGMYLQGTHCMWNVVMNGPVQKCPLQSNFTIPLTVLIPQVQVCTTLCTHCPWRFSLAL